MRDRMPNWTKEEKDQLREWAATATKWDSHPFDRPTYKVKEKARKMRVILPNSTIVHHWKDWEDRLLKGLRDKGYSAAEIHREYMPWRTYPSISTHLNTSHRERNKDFKPKTDDGYYEIESNLWKRLFFNMPRATKREIYYSSGQAEHQLHGHLI